jgi:hypothetical protein
VRQNIRPFEKTNLFDHFKHTIKLINGRIFPAKTIYVFLSLIKRMRRGLSLNESEKKEIKELYENKYSQRKIAVAIGRRKSAIQKYLSGLEGGKISSPLGRKKAVGERTMERIFGLASNKIISARNIKSKLGLNVSKRTVA